MSPGSDCPTGKTQLTMSGAVERVAFHRAHGRPARRYRCPWCGTYHVTRNVGRKQRRRQAVRVGGMR